MSEPNPLELEEQLKAENPKGKLWEACAARRVAPPKVRHATSGPRHRVQMDLELGEWELTSGVRWGWSRRVAEQLAARALLDELAALEQDEPELRPVKKRVAAEQVLGDDLFEVDPADAERHRQSNPKGQVYEWCQKQKPPMRRPRFEMRQGRGAVLVRGRLETLELTSPWFRAPRRKDAEQAAAEALLHLLPMADDDETDLDASATANPRTVLNELVQQGRLAECHVEMIGQSGSPHAPRFTAQGRAILSGGGSVQGEPVEGASKREAITGASRALLALVESGVE